MSFLSKLFSPKTTTVKTTVDRPFSINNPCIGFLNLQGPQGATLAEADRDQLSPLFPESRMSTDAVPMCQVLFIYCSIDESGRVAGCDAAVRDIIKSAGAYIAVVASDNKADTYLKAVKQRNDWPANIVLTLNRRGDKFPLFYRRLFESMFKGKSMLMTWVELAPQAPGLDHADCPESIMLAEAGHLVFNRGS